MHIELKTISEISEKIHIFFTAASFICSAPSHHDLTSAMFAKETTNVLMKKKHTALWLHVSSPLSRDDASSVPSLKHTTELILDLMRSKKWGWV